MKVKTGQVVELWWNDAPNSFAIVLEDSEPGSSIKCYHLHERGIHSHANIEQVVRIVGDAEWLLSSKIYGKR